MKSAIYPYDYDFIPCLRHMDLMKNIEIVDLLAPKGFGVFQKDAYYFGTESSGMIIRCTEDICGTDADALIITESITKMPLEQRNKEIRLLVSNVRTVIAMTSDDDIGRFLYELCNEHGVEFRLPADLLMQNHGLSLEAAGVPSERNKLLTPIVAICGISSMTQKFDLQLYLRKRFLDEGYKVSQIGTKAYSNLFGFHE